MEVSKQSRKQDSKERIEHLTPKPIKLISHLIRLFTRENQIYIRPVFGFWFSRFGCFTRGTQIHRL